MKTQKTVFLFLAFIFPICIFLFLKYFGKNEFRVPPLFLDVAPESTNGCPQAVAPYHVPDSIMDQLPFGKDTLVIVYLENNDKEMANQLNRVEVEFGKYPVRLMPLQPSEKYRYWEKCIFFLSGPRDLVLVDRKGTIRGQYEGKNREEMDRLLTELSIILRQY